MLAEMASDAPPNGAAQMKQPGTRMSHATSGHEDGDNVSLRYCRAASSLRCTTCPSMRCKMRSQCFASEDACGAHQDSNDALHDTVQTLDCGRRLRRMWSRSFTANVGRHKIGGETLAEARGVAAIGQTATHYGRD